MVKYRGVVICGEDGSYRAYYFEEGDRAAYNAVVASGSYKGQTLVAPRWLDEALELEEIEGMGRDTIRDLSRKSPV